ncbi:MAG: aspartate ammonia-lyase [Candidatus Raymondbacteria bacterium RifOxyC12_full_50_8]|uniref:Aspartate ammonia-lyase n=1 Tax=Candidatus Raymondbacteria bacterium RIFOXYD12_FULL_49_13 TaxID=1817890 RepID=A0A1F7F9N7_UNCRA|nr:MAG: aspartate ammonia-lyase [Candidatus Raymondbacteria bacterium RifOxyB12_full_50_8]OGJ93238.1 MAG: aspartate ammonia-lyase [Candidatus Raymondbacteria bacterium RIFOXYA2_FULL_49_16]OGJ98144.1 MAG: aspartate ammonia-lyase [Candidatus Raymondbacteria bacterium RifOxyC12_full_50_8]OGK03321.1 MAG: aspartate ammonia-lyase [Candidatus Raymondbacteria bacterium RIFOXYD12_FULL_49_13]OGP44960.1 MAG: aspartate ammonia-lyase [Candidatus Raymondbacteria bacterium RIFOXYB2_FULL_49_35]
MNYRTEKDLLGELNVPADAYYGIHAQRAVVNFSLTGEKTAPALIKALAMVKKACCRANSDLGFLEQGITHAIEQACDRIIAGDFADQFPVDALQGGAGTSTNMNVNEVIANLAIESLGRGKGDYAMVHPLAHVNMHQSTNDTYPTALKVALIYGVRSLSAAIAGLQGAVQEKEKAFADIVKMGRTELQDAVPMTLGAEFSAYADALARDRWRTFKCEERLRFVNIGGTAVGTGLTAPQSYIFLVIEKLREITGLGLSRGENAVDQTANADCLVEVSAILKAHACTLIKMANDLRLSHYLGEIQLPPVQQGSSIMPGKINPVITEAAMQAGMKVIANDALVSDAITRSTGQIVEFLPLAAHALLGSIDLLTRTNSMVASHVAGITADSASCGAAIKKSPSIVTAFLPAIGYERAQELVREFHAANRSDFYTFLEEKLGKELVEKTLSAATLTALGYKLSEPMGIK